MFCLVDLCARLCWISVIGHFDEYHSLAAFLRYDQSCQTSSVTVRTPAVFHSKGVSHTLRIVNLVASFGAGRLATGACGKYCGSSVVSLGRCGLSRKLSQFRLSACCLWHFGRRGAPFFVSDRFCWNSGCFFLIVRKTIFGSPDTKFCCWG